MTWAKFKKLFNPQLYSVSDSVFGKMIVGPTMTGPNLKFKSMQVFDIFDDYGNNPPKPLEIVKDQIDVFKYTYVVYYCWKHRSGTGKGIDIYYI